jgi:protein-tyrosine phosphatase
MPDAFLVLFVCTGNYYRSRFAEHLFAHLAAEQGIPWTADSVGLGVHWASKVNVGPISKVAYASLVSRGINITNPRMPRDMTQADLESAERIILLDEPEHRPMMREKFPDWEDHERVTYWKVLDVPPDEDFHPMDAIDPLVRELVEEIARA